MEAPEPLDELARLGDLYALELLDRGPNERFDRITRIARRAFGTPIALVSLVDAERQWFSSRQGLDATETPRCDAFCAHAIAAAAPLTIVHDARLDHRFADNPLVIGPPHIRFYAGAPIASARGHRIGTLCVIDRQPRELDGDDQALLRDLADVVERELHYIGLAHSDPLTGVANRRAFDEAVERMLPLAARRGRSITILWADVDGLKNVNDTRGHAAGDALLRRAALVLADSVPRSDLVARVGGDEFAVLMFDADGASARFTTGKIRMAIARDNAAHPYDPPLSISIGDARADGDEPWTDVVARADLAMYAVKRGRLQARLAPARVGAHRYGGRPAQLQSH